MDYPDEPTIAYAGQGATVTSSYVVPLPMADLPSVVREAVAHTPYLFLTEVTSESAHIGRRTTPIPSGFIRIILRFGELGGSRSKIDARELGAVLFGDGPELILREFMHNVKVEIDRRL